MITKFKLILMTCIIGMVSYNAYAEYYVVFSSPSPPVECVFCNEKSYLKTSHQHRHYKHHYHQHYRHAAHSHSSLTIYVWHNTPPVCDVYATCNVPSQNYNAYYAEPVDHTEAYINEYEDHDFDRATADDVEPDMNIDN